MTTEAIKTITVTRELLYVQLWTTPMRTLAHQYGLSDVGLAKTCKAHDIPKPPAGYWAQKQVGKAPPQTPLPQNHDQKIQQIKLWDGPRPEPVPEPPQEYDDDIQAMLDSAMSMTPVTVAATLHNLHPLIRRTRDALESQSTGEHGLVSSGVRAIPVAEITVAKSSIRRVLLFMDGLFKTIEQVGGTINIEKIHHWQLKVAVVRFAEIVVGGVRLRERYKQVQRLEDGKSRWSYPSYDRKPTGRFVLDHAPPSSCDKPFCEDGENSERPIEDKINKLIIKWVNEAGKTRIKKRQEAETQRVRAEQERIREEKEADLKRRRDELIRQQKAEQDRVDQLLHHAESWQRSQLLRSYLAAIEELLAKRPQPFAPDSESAAWLRWAYQQVDRLDPLKSSPPSILDQKLDSEQ